jgi:fructose-bisphosphate aldolase class II
MTGAMRQTMFADTSTFDPRAFLKAARASAKDLCKERYEAFGAAGKASKIRPASLSAMANRYASGELDQAVR